jgi:hypothetical protein
MDDLGDEASEEGGPFDPECFSRRNVHPHGSFKAVY